MVLDGCPFPTTRGRLRLIGVGLVAVGPTAWSGWSEWTTCGPQAKRVGLVHAATNGVAIGAYAARGLPVIGAPTAPGSRWPRSGQRR